MNTLSISIAIAMHLLSIWSIYDNNKLFKKYNAVILPSYWINLAIGNLFSIAVYILLIYLQWHYVVMIYSVLAVFGMLNMRKQLRFSMEIQQSFNTRFNIN